MPLVDWIFAATFFGSVALGAYRGVVHEVLILFRGLLALVAAQWLAPVLAQRLQIVGGSDSARYLAGFVFVLIAAVAVGALYAKLHRRFFQAPKPKPSDRVLGAVAGVLTGLGIWLSVTTAIGITPLHSDAAWLEAASSRAGVSTLEHLKPLFSSDFERHFITQTQVQ